MTNHDLKQLFTAHDASARDFIRWAAGFGVTVYDSTISRHLAGTQGLTAPWVIAYKTFFNELKHTEQ